MYTLRLVLLHQVRQERVDFRRRHVIEKAVNWSGESGKCHKAMIQAGVLEKDGQTVHDWMEHAGRKIEAYEKKKRRSDENTGAILPAFFWQNAGILPACMPEFFLHAL